MFTQGEIEQVMRSVKTSGVAGDIDFSHFGEVLDAACHLGIIEHETETIPEMETGNVFLILIVNGCRFVSQSLIWEDEWSEELDHGPVQDAVLKLLEIAVREIKKIERIRDTAYARKPSML